MFKKGIDIFETDSIYEAYGYAMAPNISADRIFIAIDNPIKNSTRIESIPVSEVAIWIDETEKREGGRKQRNHELFIGPTI